MHARTAWQALSQQPLRFLASSWPWRSLAYLLSGVGLGAVAGAAVLALAATGVVFLVVVIGAAPLLAVALSGILVARLERLRLRLVDLDPSTDPHRTPDRPGWRAWLALRLREPATWRELAFTALSIVGLWWLDLVVLGLALGVPVLLATSPLDDPSAWPLLVIGGCMVPAAPYLITAWAGARAALTRAVLAPRDAELGAELTAVQASRARLLTGFEAERRRIERDLHDGAQQRLASLNVLLGMIRLDAAPGSPVEQRLGAAQEQLVLALGELRDLVRGLHPGALTDQGLGAAVDNLATRCTVPVTVDIRLPRRLGAEVESAAYFTVAEALANVVKHSGATCAAVRARLRPDLLEVAVEDDGAGGADQRAGTGLSGLADRVAAVGGTLRISSPHGGPTLLHVEIPCR